MIVQGVVGDCMHNSPGRNCVCLTVASCRRIQEKQKPFVTSAFGCLVCVLAACNVLQWCWRGRPPWAVATLVGQGGHSVIVVVVVVWRSCGVRFAAAAAVSRTRTCGSGARACTEKREVTRVTIL